MKTVAVEDFYIIGLAVRTTNEDGKAVEDIAQLWNQFLSDNIMARIPNKVDNTIYRIYTDYEYDHTKPYTTIVGCRVNHLDDVPEGFTTKVIQGGAYMMITAKGKPADGIVFLEWVKIWNAKIPRAYTADFEVHDEKTIDPEHAEINIFVSLK